MPDAFKIQRHRPVPHYPNTPVISSPQPLKIPKKQPRDPEVKKNNNSFSSNFLTKSFMRGARSRVNYTFDEEPTSSKAQSMQTPMPKEPLQPDEYAASSRQDTKSDLATETKLIPRTDREIIKVLFHIMSENNSGRVILSESALDWYQELSNAYVDQGRILTTPQREIALSIIKAYEEGKTLSVSLPNISVVKRSECTTVKVLLTTDKRQMLEELSHVTEGERKILTELLEDPRVSRDDINSVLLILEKSNRRQDMDKTIESLEAECRAEFTRVHMEKLLKAMEEICDINWWANHEIFYKDADAFCDKIERDKEGLPDEKDKILMLIERAQVRFEREFTDKLFKMLNEKLYVDNPSSELFLVEVMDKLSKRDTEASDYLFDALSNGREEERFVLNSESAKDKAREVLGFGNGSELLLEEPSIPKSQGLNQSIWKSAASFLFG